MIVLFAVFTALVQIVDVQPVGQNGTDIGFAAFNSWFHKLTGVHMEIYTITDLLELIPLAICLLFGIIGFVQLIKRRSLFKVDKDIIFLGIYYVAVIFAFVIFEIIPVNYRPILIEGDLETSYPSSTTLLVISVMSTFIYQINRRLENETAKKIISIIAVVYTVFMVIGRLIAGVHWFTDILSSVILSTGLFFIYKAFVLLFCKKECREKRP